MANINIKLDLGQVDLDTIHTEQDARAAAKKMLPDALKRVGEALAETLWAQTQKAFSGKGFKPNNSAADKRRFIEETARKYAREASAKDKKELDDYIVEQIRAKKPGIV